jgi:predicted metal-dependent peptidase
MAQSYNLRSLTVEEIVELTDTEPMISYFLHLSHIHEDDEMKFAAGVYVKAGQPHLLMNPTMMNTFSVREKIGVIVHEFMHAMLAHCTTRTTNEENRRKTENIAKDMAINQLIVDPRYGNWDLPNGCVSHTDPRFNYPAGLSAEEYYAKIKEEHSEDDISKNFGDLGFDDHSNWSEDDDMAGTQVIKQMARRYLTGTNAQRGRTLAAGTLANSMIEEILSVENNDIDWRAKTRQWLCRVADPKAKFTWKRMSKRYGAPFQGTKMKTKNKVCAIVDTSGSMSQSFLAHIGGQLNQMSRIMQVDVVFVDAEVHGAIKKFRPSAQLAFPGRGGTDMQPGFDYAMEEGYRGVICFTDGGLWRQPECNLKTLWVVMNNRGFTSPIGEVVHVDWRE